MRITLALASLLLFSGCYDIAHDPFTLTAIEPIEIAPPDSSSLEAGNVDLLTGTVWRLTDERLLFFAQQGGNWQSYQVDKNGLVLVPEWSTNSVLANDATGSIDSYEDFASNIPSALIGGAGGVFVTFKAGKLHILNYIVLNEDGTEMAFAGRPSAEAIEEYSSLVEPDVLIPSTREGIMLFDQVPEILLKGLREDPRKFFKDINDMSKDIRWKSTDLPVPLGLSDRAGIEELHAAL